MAGQDAGRRVPADFPANLRVLLVEDDSASLVVLKKMLEDCDYRVIACQSGAEALETLRNSKDGFDIVMTNVRMPGINGLQLLAEIAKMNIDSPVILFSDDPGYDTISKGVHGGACDFLAKPIHISNLKIIWKHLLHKIKSPETGTPNTPTTSSVIHSDQQITESYEQPDYITMKRKRGSDDSIDSGSGIKENEQDQSNVTKAATATKKPRMSWKPEAHNAFLKAIKSLAPENPLPKKIQEYMETNHNFTGLTRQIISSHLQKHRENMRKLKGIQSDPRIDKQAMTGCCVRTPPPFPASSRDISSISWETPSRHQATTAPVYFQPMYQMEPQSNHLQRFPGNPFPKTVAGGYDAFLPTQPLARQIPWNSSVSPMIREQSYPGVSISSTIQTMPTNNIYGPGMEFCRPQLPLGGSGEVYHSNESCRSNVLAQGEFVDRSVAATTLEQEVADNWLKELSFEAMFQDSAFW